VIRYRLNFYDTTTGNLLLSRTQDYPDHRDTVPGVPVRIVCQEIPPQDRPPLYAIAA
jgi:hypothetical protein